MREALRMEAERQLAAMQSVNAGMAGGDSYKQVAAQLKRLAS